MGHSFYSQYKSLSNIYKELGIFLIMGKKNLHIHENNLGYLEVRC